MQSQIWAAAWRSTLGNEEKATMGAPQPCEAKGTVKQVVQCSFFKPKVLPVY